MKAIRDRGPDGARMAAGDARRIRRSSSRPSLNFALWQKTPAGACIYPANLSNFQLFCDEIHCQQCDASLNFFCPVGMTTSVTGRRRRSFRQDFFFSLPTAKQFLTSISPSSSATTDREILMWTQRNAGSECLRLAKKACYHGHRLNLRRGRRVIFINGEDMTDPEKTSVRKD
jgi:hypothetical protein